MYLKHIRFDTEIIDLALGRSTVVDRPRFAAPDARGWSDNGIQLRLLRAASRGVSASFVQPSSVEWTLSVAVLSSL
jgi:hypothetical protein